MSPEVRPQQRPRRSARMVLLAALGLVLGVSLAGCYVAPAPGPYYGGGPAYYGGPSASIYVAPPYRYGYYGYRGRRCWRCW